MSEKDAEKATSNQQFLIVGTVSLLELFQTFINFFFYFFVIFFDKQICYCGNSFPNRPEVFHCFCDFVLIVLVVGHLF